MDRPKRPNHFVAQQLYKAADIFQERYEQYGDNYKQFGEVMAVLFPEGLTSIGLHDFNRLGILVQVVSKLTRYVANFQKGGHPDSLDDMSVYAQMLQELDSLWRGEPLMDTRTIHDEFDPAGHFDGEMTTLRVSKKRHKAIFVDGKQVWPTDQEDELWRAEMSKWMQDMQAWRNQMQKAYAVALGDNEQSILGDDPEQRR